MKAHGLRYLLASSLLLSFITAADAIAEDGEETFDVDSEVLLGGVSAQVGIAPGVLKFFQEGDLDADGVANEKDECPDTRKGGVVDDAGCALALTFTQKKSTFVLESYKAFTPTLKDVNVAFSRSSGKVLFRADASSLPDGVVLRFVNLLPAEKSSASSEELCMTKGSVLECDLLPLGFEKEPAAKGGRHETMNFDVRVYVTDLQGKLSSDYHRIQLALDAAEDARRRYNLEVSRVSANGARPKTETLIQEEGAFLSRS